MVIKKLLTAALGIAAAVAIVPTAQADLNVSYQFSGLGNISIDAVGSNRPLVGNVSAVVPAGSTVVKAFLYSAQTRFQDPFVPNVSLGGTTYSGADWTFKGENNVGLSSYRADVTTQVAATINGGPGGTYDFSVTENTLNNQTDGELLAVIYSNPGEQERTIAILDGFSQTTGDSFAFNFADPLLKEAGFEASMSLGISFSAQGRAQFSQVDVNGSRITSSAGGQDDGVPDDGGLITAGGVGDSTDLPLDPFQGPNNNTRYDDELYGIESLLSDGDTSILVETLNPSNDDNIFFTAFNITAKGDVRPPNGNGVPDAGSTLVLLGISLLGMITARRRR